MNFNWLSRMFYLSKLNLGIVFIITMCILYYSFIESFWRLPKTLMALIFTISVNVLIYLILSLSKFYLLRFSFLLFFTIMTTISAIGKYYWQEIPKIEMIYDVVLKNFATINNYYNWEKILIFVILLVALLLYKISITKTENNRTFAKVKLLLVIIIGSYSFVGWRNKISSNTSSRELLAEDPIIGPFVEKKNYGVNLSSTLIENDNFYSEWNLRPGSPNIVIVNFDALRGDVFGRYIGKNAITPTFDSLINDQNVQKMPYHISSSSSSFNGILSTLYGNNVEYLPANKIGIHHILKHHGYQTNFVLGGTHEHFMSLKKQYGNVDYYFETTMVDEFGLKGKEDDDNSIIEYLYSRKNIVSDRPQFYYFHIMAPHLGAYSFDAPLFEKINNDASLTIKEKSYFIGLNKADKVLQQLLNYFNIVSNNTVIYISADHGEGLGYHKYLPTIGHIQQLTYESTNIPLIILDNDKSFQVCQKSTTQIDLVPSIVERCFNDSKLPDKFYSGLSIYKDPLNLRYTYHSLYMAKYADFHFAILKDSLGHYVEKYLYDPNTSKEYIFDLRKSRLENDTILNGNREFYRNLKRNYLQKI